MDDPWIGRSASDCDPGRALLIQSLILDVSVQRGAHGGPGGREEGAAY